MARLRDMARLRAEAARRKYYVIAAPANIVESLKATGGIIV
jgi:hypothetical protein